MEITRRSLRGESLSYILLIVIIICISFLTLDSCKENPVVVKETVKDTAAVTISPKFINGYINQRVRFTAIVTHSDSTKQVKVEWSSQDTSVASINAEGICTFKKKGGTNIYVRVISPQIGILAEDTSSVACDSLYFKFYQRELHLKSTDNARVAYNYVPFNVKLSSSDNSVVTVDSAGLLGIKNLGSSYISAAVTDTSDDILARDSIRVFVDWWSLYTAQSKISSMTYDYSINTIFIGTDKGNGIYVSRDGGYSWNQSNSGLPLNSTASITAIKTCSGSPEEAAAVIGYTGIAVSNDGGSSWRQTQSPGKNIWDIAIKPDDQNVLYTICSNPDFQIYKSTDRGSSWNLISSFPNPSGEAPKIYIDPVSPQKMYIGGHSSYRSADGGATWEMIAWPSRGPDFFLSLIDPAGNVYVQDYNWDGSLRLRLIRSTDSGSTWKVLNTYANDSYVYASDLTAGNIICSASTNSAYISTDFGQNWDKINGGFSSPPIGWSAGVVVINSNPAGFIFSVNINGRGQIWKSEVIKK